MYEPVIGFEIHIELATKSKMFCGCVNDPFGAPKPNMYTCPVCLGLPGALPVPNRKAVEWTIMLGLALGCDIPEFSKFDRKHYFYPDLPKGYQISQYDQPLCINGSIDVKSQIPNPNDQTNSKSQIPDASRIRIRRVHLEEDTAKLMHGSVNGKRASFVDFNRSGVPLMEIVTEPDIRSSEEAKVFLKKIHQIVRYLGISDADMEKGSMRLEPNISVRAIVSEKKIGTGKSRSDPGLPGYKVEVKNINSFRFAVRAIDYEIERQTRILERGEIPPQENRGWNEAKGMTVAQRSKEEAEDYRYFPEPDIPPMRWEKSQISHIKSHIGEMPEAKGERFRKQYSLSDRDTEQLVLSVGTADFFEKAVQAGTAANVSVKTIANWLINKKIDLAQTSPEELVRSIAASAATTTISPAQLEKIIASILADHPKAVADYKAGKQQALGFLMGQIMRRHPGLSADTVTKKLKARV